MGVPTTAQVVPGALVNIVLKADQPTGRTVQGTVSQLLTRGNHPRGIKVRLTDGRVGRVQSMAVAGPGTGSHVEPARLVLDHSSEIAVGAGVGLGADEGLVAGRRAGGGGRGRRRGNGMVEDIRGEEQPLSSQGIGLDAYIKPAKMKGKGRGSGSQNHGAAETSGVSGGLSQAEPVEEVCPVCGDFRGDAAAVTHHVQSHFDD